MTQLHALDSLPTDSLVVFEKTYVTENEYRIYSPIEQVARDIIQSLVLPSFQFRRADLFTRPSLEEMAIFNHKKLNQIQLRSCEKITDYHILDIKNQLFNKDERYFFTGS
jgi:hypothetical protein